MIETCHVVRHVSVGTGFAQGRVIHGYVMPDCRKHNRAPGKDLLVAKIRLQTMGDVICSSLPLTLFMCGCLQVGGLFRSEGRCSNGV